MFTFTDISLFIGASVLLILAPGPDIIFTITQGISRGRKAGVMTALGLSLGNSVHTCAAALGISIIFKTSEIAFMAFKIFGASYLFYLAWKALRSRGGQDTLSTEKEKPAALPGTGQLILKGFFMNVLNPKVALFFLAFLPQFAKPEAGSVPLQMLFLGLIFILLVAVIFGFIGFNAGHIGNVLMRNPRVQRIMDYVCSCVFIGLALKLIITGR